MKKRIISTILVLALALTLCTGAFAKGKYSDVPDDAWYADYVYALSEKGIISGYSDGTFRPDGTVTYGQALKLILMASGFGEQPQTDTHWASGYLDLAQTLGMVGTGVDLNAPVTRLVIAHIAANALGLKTDAESPFIDTKESAATALYMTGVITGTNSDEGLRFNGGNFLKRSEISAIIYRITTTNFDIMHDEPDEPKYTEIQEGMTHILVDCTGYLNIREAPDTNSAVKGHIPAGNTALLMGSTDGWYIVDYNGTTGYVSAEYCTQVDYETTNTATGIRNEIITYAKQFAGIKYSYGGASPNGFDCSGFTMYVMKQYGYYLDHSARAQYSSSVPINKSDLLPGDLVFFSNASTTWIGHVGIYIGNGLFIHASSGKSYCVTISSLDNSWYVQHYVAAGRIVFE